MGNSVTRFFLERDFFHLSLAQDRKNSRVAVKNSTTDLWGHGYSEFVHCPLLMKICFYFSFTLFTHKNFSLCLQSFPSLPCWAQSLVWSQQVRFFTQAFRGLSNNKVLSLLKRTSFRTKGLISSQKETDLMVMRLLKHNPELKYSRKTKERILVLSQWWHTLPPNMPWCSLKRTTQHLSNLSFFLLKKKLVFFNNYLNDYTYSDGAAHEITSF